MDDLCVQLLFLKNLRAICYRLKYFDVYTHIYNNKYNNIKYLINIKNTIETIVLKLFNSIAIIKKICIYFKINYFSVLCCSLLSYIKIFYYSLCIFIIVYNFYYIFLNINLYIL